MSQRPILFIVIQDLTFKVVIQGKERGELNISKPLVEKEKTKINGLMRIASIALADDLGKPCYDVHAYTERFLSDEVRKTGWSRRTTGKMMM